MKTKYFFRVSALTLAALLFRLTFIYMPVNAQSGIEFLGTIGSNTIKDSGIGDLVVTTTASVPSGTDIIIAYATDPSQDLNISVTDAAGNKYQQAAMAISVGNLRTFIFASYNVNPMPAGSTIIISQVVYSTTAVAARAAVVALFDGLAPEGALEQSSVSSGSNTAPTSGAIVTIQPNQLLIGAVGTEGPEGDAAGSWSNSFTEGPRAGTTGGTDATTNITVSMGWQIVTTSGSYTAAKTGITSRDWAGAIASFKTTDAGISYIGNIGSAQSKTAGTNLSITTSSGVSAGDDIMISFAMDGSTGDVTAVDNAGNTYVQSVNVQFSTPSNTNVRNVLLTALNVNALPSGSTITITHPSVTARSAVASVFRGLANAEALDQVKTATGTTNTVSSGATSTTTQADELLIGSLGLEGPNVDAPSVWQNSFTYGPRLGTSFGASSGDATDITAQMGWRIVNTTGSYTAQIVNLNTTRDWAVAIATFKAQSGDVSNPTVTINQAASQPDPTSDSPINFTVIFSEPVTGFSNSDVILSGTAGANTVLVTGSGTTYNVAVSDMISSGTVIASIPEGVATDAAGNPNIASTSTDNTVTFSLANAVSGDLNGDGEANSTDALIVLSCDAGINTSNFCPCNCGDVNTDGYVNSTDALIILSYDVGMTVPFDVEQPGCPASVTPCPGCNP